MHPVHLLYQCPKLRQLLKGGIFTTQHKCLKEHLPQPSHTQFRPIFLCENFLEKCCHQLLLSYHKTWNIYWQFYPSFSSFRYSLHFSHLLFSNVARQRSGLVSPVQVKCVWQFLCTVMYKMKQNSLSSSDDMEEVLLSLRRRISSLESNWKNLLLLGQQRPSTSLHLVSMVTSRCTILRLAIVITVSIAVLGFILVIHCCKRM